MIITIEIPNLPRFISAMARSPITVQKHINTAINRSIYEVKSRTQSVTPVMTGRLRVNWQETFRNLYGELKSMQEYAIWVHEGHKQEPGRYVPAIGKRLKKSFVKGQPFLRQGVDSSMPMVRSIFDRSLNDALNEIAREAR